MVREVLLHPAGEKATDADTLDKRQVQRVPVPGNLEKGFVGWLMDTLPVEYVLVEHLHLWLTGEEVAGTSLSALIRWDDVVHVRKPGGRRRKQRKERASSDARVKAFKLEYQNSENVSTMHRALTCIMQQANYAPTAGLFQSSGWGKSRLVCELYKEDVWVVYCSFAAGNGYPASSRIAKWFHEQAMMHLGTDESLQGQLACMDFTLSYFIACIRVLAERVNNSGWSPEQFLIETREGSMYWEDVQMETDKLLGEIDSTETQNSKQLTWTVWDMNARVRFVDLCPKNFMEDEQKLRVLFVFDEARHLVKNLNCFLPIRRATRAASGRGVVVLFMDTSSEISNFSAPDWADSSDRVAAGGVMLAPPIWGTFSADISEKDSLQLFSTRTLNDIVNPHWAVRYGRPLWWATFKSYLPDTPNYTQAEKQNAFRGTYELAQDKLLGGTGEWVKYITQMKNLPEEAAFSLLGATIGLDVDPRSKLASKLVANHLLTVLSVSPTRELVWTAWCSEPLVSMAATEAIRCLNASQRFPQLYGPLVHGLAAGWIDRGFTGELVAKIILLNAQIKREPGLCTVDEFCKNLVGKSLQQLIGRALTANEEKLANARLHFNSFRRIYKKLSDMTLQDFLKLAERGCAMQCVAGAWGVDLIIVAFTGDDDAELTVDNITVIYVQVKLEEIEYVSNVTLAKVSPHYAGLSVALKLPYLSLYMNVFDNGNKASAYWVHPTKISDSVEASSLKPIQDALTEIKNGSTPKKKKGRKRGAAEPASQAWKAWLQARDENLQTVLVVKGLEAFELDEGLKHQLKLIVKSSRSPFFTDDHNSLHKELLELQKSGLQQMFKIENFWDF